MKRATLVCGAAYFGVLAAVSTVLGTWTDEEYTLATTAHGLSFAWRRAIDYELQAPLYFAVLALWRELDASVWFARLFSILCATAFFFALVPILRRVAPGREPLPAALFIALNPFVIYAAFDIRLYAPALLISALTWLACDAGFISGDGRAARLWFGILAVIGLYTQYFLGFAFVAYAAILAVNGRRRALVRYILVLAIAGIFSLPLVGILRSQIGGSGETTAGALSLLRQTLLHPLLEFIMPYERSWDALHVRAPYIVLVTMLAALSIYARPRLRPTLGAALAAAATIEVLFVAVVLIFRLALDTRHYVVLFVPAIVAGYALVAALERSRRPWLGTLIGWTYAALTLAVLYAQHSQFAQDGDSKRVAAYLAARAERGAVVAIFPADALAAYARQYHGDARLVPFPKAIPARHYDIDAIDVHDEGEALAGFAELRGSPQLWLVMLGSCENGDQQYGCEHVLAAIHDGTRVESERRFFDSRVFRLNVTSVRDRT